MQTTNNGWLDFLRVGLLIIPLLLSSLFTIEPKAEERPRLVCSVHQEHLKQDVVQITYGLIGPLEKGYVEAALKLFPHSNKDVLGGCVISWNSQKFQTVDYCSLCRRAETEWRRTRANKD